MSPQFYARALSLAVAVAIGGVAGCGSTNTKSAADVRSCVEKAGLPVTRESLPAVRESLFVELPNANRVFVNFYDSEQKAQQGERDARIFATETGGTVERKGSVVYALTHKGGEQQFQQIKGCL